jgi:hypothetical protein
MYDIQKTADLIRANGQVDVELPFESLIVYASNSKIRIAKVGTRADLRSVISGFFGTLRSDSITVGLFDPSTGGLLTIGDSDERLGISINQKLSEDFLDDLWLVLCAMFQALVILSPAFPQACADLIDWGCRRQLEKHSLTN